MLIQLMRAGQRAWNQISMPTGQGSAAAQNILLPVWSRCFCGQRASHLLDRLTFNNLITPELMVVQR